MFQSFTAPTSPEQGPPRLLALRTLIKQRGLDGFLVPRADAFQGEYVAPCDERLAWLTGFTGSAGFCAVLDDVAGVFIDGRYRLQVLDQVAPDFTPVHWPEVSLAEWMNAHECRGKVIGFDPWLHTVKEMSALREAAPGIEFRATDNLVDAIWTDRPDRPKAKFFAHPLEFSGKDHNEKLSELSDQLKKAGQKCAVFTLPDSIAWLLNIRGNDIEKNPVPQSFAVLNDDGTAQLFAPAGKTEGLETYLGERVSVFPLEHFQAALSKLTGPVRIDPKSCPELVWTTLRTSGIATVHGADLCELPKACKNLTEIAGTREAHLRDGAAMVRFLAWFEEAAPKGGVTEIDVVRTLEGFRRETNALKDISFDTIAGAGPNGAVIHYRVTEDTNRTLSHGDLIVVDSGGQYLDGTTDITRTISVGEPGNEERRCYTRVLQGMIAISRARFPRGLAGQHIDALARFPLWCDGLDFDHGTGHGVGSYLCVHEGPQRISRISDVPLQPGMILSNEPGYYRAGAFGIRIENLIVVKEAAILPKGDAHRSQLDFEPLTFVPLDRRLIDASLLSKDEKDWIDAYHAATLRVIGPRVDGKDLHWLNRACAPL